jgi:chorismate mutase
MEITKILERFREVMPNMTEQEAFDMSQPVVEIVSEIYADLQAQFPTIKTITDNRHSVVEIIKDSWGR